MATYNYKQISNGAVFEFEPNGDLLWVNDKSVSAADFRIEDLYGAGTSLVLTTADKSFTLEGASFTTIDSINISFANGSMLVNSSASNLFGDNLFGGAKNDLLIGGQAAKPIAMVSVSAGGTPGDQASYDPVLSADGRFVAFHSYASNLIVGGPDTNGFYADVFVKDLLTGTLRLVSADAFGYQGNSESYAVCLAGDGSKAAFTSFASNLTAGDNNNAYDIFVKDLNSGLVTRASVSGVGEEANGSSSGPSISGDGRFVAFYSDANNLVAGDANNVGDVFVKDLQTGAVTLASSLYGTQGNSYSYDPSFAFGGSHLAFTSSADNLVDGDGNFNGDVFVRNMVTGALSRASTSSAGVEANAASFDASLSGDGRYVAFASDASNLVADTNNTADIFVKDLQTGVLTRVSTSTSGAQANGYSSRPSISADGRFVTFQSDANNLVTGDTNGIPDVFVKDMWTGTTTRVSVSAAGEAGNNWGSVIPAISADGSTIAFYSFATNLTPGGSNGQAQVYTVTNPLESRIMSGGAGNDAYLIFRASDQVVEASGEGTDTVRSYISYLLPGNVEKLELLGDESISGTGNALDNVLTGNAGDNLLDGGTGVDTASYAASTAAVTVNLGAGAARQETGAGIDTLIAIENLTGSAWDDALGGDANANKLDGGAGADTMLGFAGDDVYFVDQAGDQVFESSGAGTDVVQSTISWTLGDNLENLTLLGSASINATGNGLDNRLVSNSGNNVLNGGGGSDTASFGNAKAGVVVGLDIAGPQFTNAGLDTLTSIENLVGSKLSDTLHGNAGNNILNGSDGIDTLSYARAAAAVTVNLATSTAQATGGAGNDTISNFENLTGGGFNDSLSGSGGANTLDGGAGADTMTGGGGNDLYIVDNAGDAVVEAAGGGTDTVQSSLNYVLGAEVENLVLTGDANLKGKGNALNNVLTGNGGANILDGGDGADTASYATAAAAVNVNLATGIATGGGGSDTLNSIERLIGSAYADTLVGNSAGNRIEGGAGSDALTGGAGADTFTLNSLIGSDTISDFLSASDKASISQAAVRVGDGDTVIDSAATVAGPGGFAASAELVIVTANIAGGITAAHAAAAIGSADSSYAVGQSALFAVDDGSSSALYYFVALDANSAVSESELTLLAMLTGTPATAAGDYLFGA